MRSVTAVASGILLALVACNFPKSKGPATPREEIDEEEPYRSPPAAAQPQPNPMDEWDRIRCATSLVVDQRTWSGERLVALTKWMEESTPLMDQFKFTPWEEVPSAAKPEIEARWYEMRRTALAKYAIEHRVAVSSIECKPEVPDCDRFSASYEGVGSLYSALLLETMGRALELAQTSYDASSGLADGYRKAIETYPVWQALSDRHEENSKVYETMGHFFKLLPKSALLPKCLLPPQPEMPEECKGVLDKDPAGSK